MKSKIAIFFYFATIVGLLCSRTLLTIAMAGLVAAALFNVEIKPFRFGFNPSLKTTFQRLFKRPDYLAIIGIFILALFSFGNSSETKFLIKDIVLKLPFLILPLAFLNHPKLSQRQLAHVFYIFLACTSIACLGVGINYYLDFAYITNSINLGKSVPTPIHHIRFSLLVAFATVVGFWLIFIRHYWKYNWEKWLIIGLTGFVFLMQHVLSVRSGLVVMYAALSIMAIYYVFYTKKLWLFGVFIPLMIALQLVAYHTIPTLKNKVRYLLYDLDMFKNGNRAGFSDGQRLISLSMGAEVVKENLVFGTGIGDLKTELAKQYATHYPDLKPKLPHNQFLTITASMGFVGLAAFTFLFFFPLFYHRNYRFVVMASFYTIMTLSFMFENTLATQFGLTIYLLFLLLILQVEKYNE